MRQFYQIDYFENLDLRFATVRPLQWTRFF